MEKCVSCDKEIGNAKFCGHCGAEQACPACGVEYESTSAFCTGCGTKKSAVVEANNRDQSVLPSIEKVTESIKASASRLGKKNLYIIGTILAAIILIIIMQNNSNNDPQKVVKHFIKAVNNKDMTKAMKYVDTRFSQGAFASADLPEDAAIKIKNIENLERNNEYATVSVTADITPEPYGGNPETVEFELRKINGKWLIVDAN